MTRQASLSPHLRSNLRDAARPSDEELVPAPEQARQLAAALQSGWQRGREASAPAQPPPPEQDAETQNREDG